MQSFKKTMTRLLKKIRLKKETGQVTKKLHLYTCISFILKVFGIRHFYFKFCSKRDLNLLTIHIKMTL